MSDPTTQRLQGIANGNTPRPTSVNLTLTNEQGIILAVQDTVLGAVENGMRVLQTFGCAEEAEAFKQLAAALSARGKAIVDSARNLVQPA